MIDRRAVLALPALLPAASLAWAQTAEPPLVVWIGFASAKADQPALAALRQGLAELGHIDGRTIRLEAWHAESRLDGFAAAVKQFETRRVAVFVAGGRAAARELVRLTKAPIVSGRLPESDPELFASLAQPGGNVTGYSNFAEQLHLKQIEILNQVVPDLKTVAILYSATANRDLGSEPVKAAAAFGLRSIRLELGADPRGQFRQLMASARPAGAGALVVVQDFGTITIRDEIYALALQERLPTVADQRDMAESGALLTYGGDIDDLFRRTAGYVDKILKGAKPADLPIQLATKLQLIVNLRTAKALGLTLPTAILLRADEVLE